MDSQEELEMQNKLYNEIKEKKNITTVSLADNKFVKFDFNNDNTILRFVNTDFASLGKTHFHNIYFEHINFENCNFSNIEFTHMWFSNCSFYNCIFTETKLLHTVFQYCSFNHLESIHKVIEDVLFQKCDFKLNKSLRPYFQLRNLHFKKTTFNACLLQNIDFQSSIFEYSVIGSQTNMELLEWKQCNFENCQLINSTFANVGFEKCVFVNVKSSSVFNNVVFQTNCYFDNSEFNVFTFENGVKRYDVFVNVLFLNNRYGSFENGMSIMGEGENVEDAIVCKNFIFDNSQFPNSTFKNMRIEELESPNPMFAEGSYIKGNDQGEYANFTKCSFINCNMRHSAYVDQVDFFGSTFEICDLGLLHSRVNYEEAIFTETNFEDRYNNNDDIFPVIRETNFKNAYFNETHFVNADIWRTDFSGEHTYLENVEFDACILTDCILSQSPNDIEPAPKKLKNIFFSSTTLDGVLFKNKIQHITFDHCTMEHSEFEDNRKLRDSNFLAEHNLELIDCILPEIDYEYYRSVNAVGDHNVEQQESIKRGIINDVLHIEDVDVYTMRTFNKNKLGNRLFPSEDGHTYSIFDLIQGDLTLTSTFFEENPTYRLLCKLQTTNIFPHIIDLEIVEKFINDLKQDVYTSYLRNIVFLCGDFTNEREIIQQRPYVNMSVFGISGLMVPLKHIMSLLNNQNINNKIFILDDDSVFNSNQNKVMSLDYALTFESTLNCSEEEPIRVANLKYYDNSLRSLTPTTPLLSPNNMLANDNQFIPINESTEDNVQSNENTEYLGNEDEMSIDLDGIFDDDYSLSSSLIPRSSSESSNESPLSVETNNDGQTADMNLGGKKITKRKTKKQIKRKTKNKTNKKENKKTKQTKRKTKKQIKRKTNKKENK